MSARAVAVLDRFPRHLAATDPEKRFEHVVRGLVDALEVLTRQAADVRRAHRLGEAATDRDLALLAGLHALRAPVWALLARRTDGTDLTHDEVVELRRSVVAGLIAAHVTGNGTPRALLTAAAAYLGLEVERISPTSGRWWTLASCRDRLAPREDVLALEENPFREADLAPAPRPHARQFQVVRGGLEDVDVTVRVLGVGTRTVRPLVVQTFAGHGLAYEGPVPEGSELRFEASGRVTLDGTVVTGSAWEFRGAVFADAGARREGRDFVFAGDPADGDRQARFVVTSPLVDALEDAAPFPHGAGAVGPLRLPLGESRWVAFVRLAHTSTVAPGAAAPRTKHARFDHAVLAAQDGLDGPTAGDPSLQVGFAWEEREPFAVRVLLPGRLQDLDDEQGTRLREPLRQLLDRHRAAGVHVRVEYADPRWTLGTGVVRDTPDEALGTVLAGTALWPDGTPQPGTG